MHLQFQYNWLLFALIPIVLSFIYVWLRKSSVLERQRLPMLFAAMVLLVIAISNPYWSYERRERLYKGVDLVLLLDVSQSMFCPVDGKSSRIDETRSFLRSLLPQFSGSNIAVVYFAGDAQLGCPFTADLQSVSLFIDSITPGMTTRAGTRSEPLTAVLQTLAGRNVKQIISGRKPLLLLFSDGEFFDKPQRLINWIKRNNVSVFAFVSGSGKSPVPKFNLSGFYPKAESEVRPEVLTQIALAGNGRSYKLHQAAPHLIVRDIVRQVSDNIEKGEPVPAYRYRPFLIAASLLLIVYQIAPLYRSAKAQPGVAGALLILLAVSVSMSLDQQKKTFDSAMKDYRQRRYDSALKKLTELQKTNSAAEIDVAIGNIYFRQNQMDKAVKHYRKAVEKEQWNNVARWNWEIALKRQTSPKDQPPDDNQQQQSPPPPGRPAPEDALLKYSDQKEKEQMQQNNRQQQKSGEFAW